MNALALSMIVKNAAAFLPQCLESVRGVVQEIIIADTGSTDCTIRIAESAGARVLSIPWNNDFAQARNLCLDEVRSPWVLSLDADELLDRSAHGAVAALLANPTAEGYRVTIRNFVLSLQDRVWDQPALPNHTSLPAAAKYPAYVDHENVRLFRNHKQIRFAGRVHESVGPSLLKQKRGIASANFVIYHFGLALSAEERAAKNRFYRELGRQKILETPNDAQAHLELGILELDSFANLDQALHLFSRACRLNPRLAPAWFFHGLALLRKEQFAEALCCLQKSENLGNHTALLAETKGDTCYNSGAFPDAVASYETALRRDPASPSLISKLGLAQVRAGERQYGFAHLVSSIQRCPESGELHDRLMLAHLSSGNLTEAAEALEAKLASIPNPSASDFLRAAALCSKAELIPRASHLLDLGLQFFPEDKNLLTARQEISNLLSSQQVPSSTAPS